MKLKYINYPNGIHQIEFKESVKSLGLSEEFVEDVLLTCKMDKSSSQIVLNCDVTFNVNFDCDRCSKNVIKTLHTDFVIIKVFEKENDDLDDMNTSYLPPNVVELDFGSDLQDFLVLSIPLKKICNEDCKGLCPSCGSDLNTEECHCTVETINPQWNALLKLKDKLN